MLTTLEFFCPMAIMQIVIKFLGLSEKVVIFASLFLHT